MAVELNRTIQVFPQPTSLDTSEVARSGKETTKDHGRTVRQAIFITFASALILTTFAGAGMIQRMRRDPNFDMQMRQSSSQINIFRGFEFFLPTTNEILQEYALDIQRIAEQYRVSSQSLEYIIIKELGDDRNGVPTSGNTLNLTVFRQ